jgi:carboxypeptidase C (cathepsin A)
MITVGHCIHIIYDYSIKLNYYNYMQYYNIFMIIHYRNMHDYMDVKLSENQNLLYYMGCTTKMVMNFINMTLFIFFSSYFWLTNVIIFQV